MFSVRRILALIALLLAVLTVSAIAHVVYHDQRHYAVFCNNSDRPVSVDLTAEGGVKSVTLLHQRRVGAGGCVSSGFHNRADREFVLLLNGRTHVLDEIYDSPYAFSYKKYQYTFDGTEVQSARPQEFFLGLRKNGI